MFDVEKGNVFGEVRRPFFFSTPFPSNTEPLSMTQYNQNLAVLPNKAKVKKYGKFKQHYKLFKAFEFLLPGLMLCFVAMPGPFLVYMSRRQRIAMRVYQSVLYICFGLYECVRLREYIHDYMRNPTSLICFFHSCINTAIVPIIYIHVAYNSSSLQSLLEKIESDVLTGFNKIGAAPRKHYKRYILATTVLLLTFHSVNVARSIFEEPENPSERSVYADVLFFIGKQAHHFVIQTMYCGLESLTVALLFLLYLQFYALVGDVKSIKEIDEDRLAQVQKRYRAISDIYDSVQAFLSPLLFLFFFRTMFDFVSSLTYYSIQTDRVTKIWVLIYEGLLTLLNVWQNTAISEMAQLLEMEMRNTLYIASKIPADEGATKLMLIFLQVFRDRPDPMYGCGVLRINRSLMFTMYGSTLTVVLVLVQMDPTIMKKLTLD